MGTATGGRSLDGKDRTFFWGGVYVVGGRGGGNSALMDFIAPRAKERESEVLLRTR